MSLVPAVHTVISPVPRSVRSRKTRMSLASSCHSASVWILRISPKTSGVARVMRTFGEQATIRSKMPAIGPLAEPEDHLRKALPRRPAMIDAGIADVFKR
jgi:hypothetical protein